MSASDMRERLRQMWKQARLLREREEWRQAIEMYTRIVNLAPGFAPAYMERGLLIHEMGNPEKAMFDFERAIELNPEYGPGYYGRMG